jgi:hypothetical protein
MGEVSVESRGTCCRRQLDGNEKCLEKGWECAKLYVYSLWRDELWFTLHAENLGTQFPRNSAIAAVADINSVLRLHGTGSHVTQGKEVEGVKG